MAAHGRQPVAHVRHVLPLLDLGALGGALGRRDAERATEGDDARGAGRHLARDEPGLLAAQVHALGLERGQHLGRDLGIGLGARGFCGNGQAALLGETLEIGGGQHALGCAVQADEKDLLLCHG
jgi:hypothetical protein